MLVIKTFLMTLINNRLLLFDLIKRDFIGRYKGSILGVAWSFFNPLLMLMVYTFLFKIALKARWEENIEKGIPFSIVIFSGMILHGLFAECINSAPTLIVERPNFVKKIVFPLEILPFVKLGSALLHFILSLIILIIFCLVSQLKIDWTILYIPIVIMPLIFSILGFCWFFSALGVYLRDLNQAVGMFTTVIQFLAPVFYPISALPTAFQFLLQLNPITYPIIQIRELILWHGSMLWLDWSINTCASMIAAYLGLVWFQKTRKGFADVL